MTIERMTISEKWGQLGKDIIHAKYRKNTRPDSVIYTTKLFCTERTFYRTLNNALDFFADVLPARFRKKVWYIEDVEL